MITGLYFSGIVGAQPHWGDLRKQETELTLRSLTMKEREGNWRLAGLRQED